MEAAEFAPAMGPTDSEKSMPVVATDATPGGATTSIGIVIAVVTVVLELISDELTGRVIVAVVVTASDMAEITFIDSDVAVVSEEGAGVIPNDTLASMETSATNSARETGGVIVAVEVTASDTAETTFIDDASESMETSVTESATVGMRVMFAGSCGIVVEEEFITAEFILLASTTASGFFIYM